MTNINNKQKALIHIAKSKVGMTNDEYRDLLGSVGVTSSKDLNQAKFDVLMKRFKDLGFTSKRSGNLGSKDRMMRKVDAVLSELGLTRQYADAISRHMFKIDLVAWCNPHQLQKVIAALTYHKGRNKKREKEPVNG